VIDIDTVGHRSAALCADALAVASTSSTSRDPRVVSRDEWLAARKRLRVARAALVTATTTNRQRAVTTMVPRPGDRPKPESSWETEDCSRATPGTQGQGVRQLGVVCRVAAAVVDQRLGQPFGPLLSGTHAMLAGRFGEHSRVPVSGRGARIDRPTAGSRAAICRWRRGRLRSCRRSVRLVPPT
jgi:hypothetical protein